MLKYFLTRFELLQGVVQGANVYTSFMLQKMLF